jgi:lysophospholipase L1-like esterase
MKRMKFNIIILALAVLAFACKPMIDVPAPSAGTANFTTYVSLGNSLTSGYADGDLFRSGQLNSYPLMLATQFNSVGRTGDFKQPLMVDETGFGSRVKFTGMVAGVPTIVPYGAANAANFASIAAAGPYYNMGVPGAKSYHLPAVGYGNPANGAGNYNPYFARFAVNPATSSILGDALALHPTFYSLWIGNNDVLLYAIDGGNGGADAITPLATFTASVTAVVTALKATGAKGVMANIPDISSLPFFNTVPYNPLLITDATQLAQLNAAYGNGALGISFTSGYNRLVIADPLAPMGMRQIKSTELVLLSLPTDSLKLKGWGTQKPVPAKYILDETELASIRAAITNFNASLATIAAANNVPMIDMNAKLLQVKAGMVISGMKFNTSFISGGLFSLDGIHLTPRGYAIVANYFIDGINSYYSATVPRVEISGFHGIVFP